MIIASRPRSCPTVWLLFYFFEIVVETAFITSRAAKSRSSTYCHSIVIAVSCASIFVITTMPFRAVALPPEDVSAVGSTPSDKHRSPEDNLKLWQFLTVSWMAPLISMGNKRTLNEEDIWTLAYQFQHARLHEQFRRLKGSVVWRLIKANGVDFFVITITGLLGLVCGLY